MSVAPTNLSASPSTPRRSDGADAAAFWSVAAISAAAGALVVLLNTSHGCAVPAMPEGKGSNGATMHKANKAIDPAERALRAWRLA